MKTILFILAAGIACAQTQTQVDYLTQVKNVPTYDIRKYSFPAQYPGGTLTGGFSASATLHPCPLGVAGADTNHWLLIGGTGVAEGVLITGGSCTSGASSGTVTFTPANSHSPGWSISSATNGAQEAINIAAGTHGGTVIIPSVPTLNQYGTITIATPSIILQGAGMPSEYPDQAAPSTLLWMGAPNKPMLQVLDTTAANIRNIRFDGNLTSSPVVDISGCEMRCVMEYNQIENPAQHGTTLSIEVSVALTNSALGRYKHNSIRAYNPASTSWDSSAIRVGVHSFTGNSGVFKNVIEQNRIFFSADTATSYGIDCQMCDNNIFRDNFIQPWNSPPSGCAVHLGQPSGDTGKGFPYSNTFEDTFTGGQTLTGVCGNNGQGGNYFPNYDIYDSGANASTGPYRMYLRNGQIAGGETQFLQQFWVTGQTGVAAMYMDASESAVPGTVTSVGTAVTGVGTNFTSACKVNRTFSAFGQYRFITAIADDTHLTIDRALASDITAGATGFCGTGATWTQAVDGSNTYAGNASTQTGARAYFGVAGSKGYFDQFGSLTLPGSVYIGAGGLDNGIACFIAGTKQIGHCTTAPSGTPPTCGCSN